jgi:2,4-dichlorophenol 6-monooxygenase
MIIREYEPEQVQVDTSEQAVRDQARTMIGDPDAEVHLKQASKWTVNDVVAREYRRGRVFLVGDAAHRHPPTGGLGSNTSIQDSFNLAWKLAFVLSGRAGEDLLDSYDEERQPIGRQIVNRAMKGIENQLALTNALGLNRDQSAEEGWATLNELFSDTDHSAERREGLAAAVKLQDYRSNAQGVELGQHYTSCAVLGDGMPFPAANKDRELYYQPTTHPGACLPHVWVEHNGTQVSTLDLVGHGRFTLIVGIGGQAWAEAAGKAHAELDVELRVVTVGPRCEFDDVFGDWAAIREIGDRGALLIRPDRHVAWRCADRVSSPEETLRSALRGVLSRTDRPAPDSEESHGGTRITLDR